MKLFMCTETQGGIENSEVCDFRKGRAYWGELTSTCNLTIKGHHGDVFVFSPNEWKSKFTLLNVQVNDLFETVKGDKFNSYLKQHGVQRAPIMSLESHSYSLILTQEGVGTMPEYEVHVSGEIDEPLVFSDLGYAIQQFAAHVYEVQRGPVTVR